MCFCDVSLVYDDLDSEIDCCLPEDNFFGTLNVHYSDVDSSVVVMLCSSTDYDEVCEIVKGSASAYFMSNSSKSFYLKKVSHGTDVVNVNVSVSYVDSQCELFHSHDSSYKSVTYLNNDIIHGYNGYVYLDVNGDCRERDFVEVVNVCPLRVGTSLILMYAMLPISYIMLLMSCCYSSYGVVKKNCRSKRIDYSNSLPCLRDVRCGKCNNCLLHKLSEGVVQCSEVMSSHVGFPDDADGMSCSLRFPDNEQFCSVDSLKRRPVSDSVKNLNDVREVSFVAEASCGGEVEVCKSSCGVQAD